MKEYWIAAEMILWDKLGREPTADEIETKAIDLYTDAIDAAEYVMEDR